jgi:hypothetical protein
LKLSAKTFALSATLSLAGLFPLGCGNPDNLVVGGVLGSGIVPNATITVVGSAISGTGNIADPNGSASPREFLLLSDVSNLCATLTANPDFLETPSSAFVLLVLSMPVGTVGTFYPGASGTEAGLYASAQLGGPVFGYPGVGGTVIVNHFDTQSDGNFDVLFIDTVNSETEVYGQFKTTQCDAIANALIPNIVVGH